MQMHQGASVNSSKSFHQNIKRFFKKFLMFSKKSCQVFRQLFSPVLRNILPLISDYNRKKRRFSSKIHFICKILPKIFAGSKKKPYLCIAFETRDIGRLAQLVQSICLTSRGSAVRIRQRPLKTASLLKKKNFGRLAQLVQSICLTSRGSAVRIRQRPPKTSRSGAVGSSLGS